MGLARFTQVRMRSWVRVRARLIVIARQTTTVEVTNSNNVLELRALLRAGAELRFARRPRLFAVKIPSEGIEVCCVRVHACVRAR
jgi:hypothetical protein